MTVAKIEGSPSYKYEMRRLLEESLHLYKGTAQISPTPRHGGTRRSWATKKLQSLSQTLHLIPTPPENPITAMFRALKTSTESFLSQEIHYIEIAVPLNPPSSHDNQKHFLDEMLYSLGLVRTNQRPTPVNAAAGRVYALQHPEVYNYLEYILAVDYSRAGLMLTIDEVDMTVSEEKYRKWRGDLGSDALSEKSDYWQLVEGEIRKSVQQGRERRRSDYLLLIGDRVLIEPRLLEILKNVLGEDTYNKVLTRSGVGGLEIDPVFEAASAMARMSQANVFRSPEGCEYSGNCEGAENLRDEL